MGKSKKKIHDARSQKIGRKKKKKRTGYKYLKYNGSVVKTKI